MNAPEIVVLCGSTRFREAFTDTNRDLTLDGKIVLAPGVFAHSGHTITEEQKACLDTLHFRKIDLAHRVVVVNPGGYIGASTHREIAYATLTGTPIDYLVPPAVHVEKVAAEAITAAGGNPAVGIVVCRQHSKHAGVVVLHLRGDSNALAVERPLIDAGYRLEPGDDVRPDTQLLVSRSTCMACPPDCGTCTGEQADCECYEHQGAAVAAAVQLAEAPPPPKRAEPIEPRAGDVWHDSCPSATGGQLWHARYDGDGRVELFEQGGLGAVIPAHQVASMRGGMTLVMRGGVPAPSAPCISWQNFMSDRDTMNTTHLVGPFMKPAERDAELARLKALPNGAPEYNGGAIFTVGTWEEAHGAEGWDFYVAHPSQVAAATTLEEFFALFDGVPCCTICNRPHAETVCPPATPSGEPAEATAAGTISE